MVPFAFGIFKILHPFSEEEAVTKISLSISYIGFTFYVVAVVVEHNPKSHMMDSGM